MNLFFLRHAKAEPFGNKYKLDRKRPLTSEGEKIMKCAAQGMVELELSFDLIMTSPYVRALRTAEITAKAFKTDNLCTSQNLMCEGDPRKLIDEINDNYPSLANLLLVGHEPYLGKLVSVLLTGKDDLQIDFKKSALCKLSTDDLRYGRCATLEWFLTPRQLQQMAAGV
jgi:phosphohistidine phosphatase